MKVLILDAVLIVTHLTLTKTNSRMKIKIPKNLPEFDYFPHQPHFPWELHYNHFFGINNLSMKNVFLLPTREEVKQWTLNKELDKEEPEEIWDDGEPKDAPKLDEGLLNNENFKDGADFDKIKDDLKNLTHVVKGLRTRRYSFCRWFWCYPSFVDAEDYPRNVLWWEKKKIERVNNLTLSFLIHMRYKVKEAIEVRNLVQTDKRYKLGYMFNRLRRLGYDQRKIFTAMSFMEEDYKFRSVYRSMRMYKMIVRYEVDIRDTIDTIKDIYYNIEDPPIFSTNRPRFRKNSTKSTNATDTTTTPKGIIP